MVFSSAQFLFLFLPVTLLINFLLKEKFRNLFLFIASLIFYAVAQPKLLYVLLVSILINYVCALLAGRVKSSKVRTADFVVGICLNLGLLFYFKYFNFAIDLLNKLGSNSFAAKDIVMPLGISFYTFSGISYLADVYHRRTDEDENILNVALFIAFFPKLLEGPITRYGQIKDNLPERKVTVDDFSYGIERFIVGLAKKAIIANALGSTVDSIWNAGIAQNTVGIAWLGSIAYTLQIYFDFAGYSDMAIGIGRMFGFHIAENFDLPYISKGISEFWRRWHMTLGSWFRDYLYIPLGGNRKGKFRTYVNLAIVFLLTGLWHGASIHFVVWGLFNGFFVIVERIFRANKIQCKWMPAKVRNILLHVYALFVTNIAWIFFRAPHTRDALEFIGTMFGIGLGSRPGFDALWYANRWIIFVLVVAVVFSSSLPTWIIGRINMKTDGKKSGKVMIVVKYAVLLVLLYLSILRIVSGTYNAFIYFQF